MSVPLVTFVWPDAGGERTGVMHVPWQKGWSVQRYMHTQPLRQYGLLGLVPRCRMLNNQRQKVRLIYQPPTGDVVVLVRVSRS